MSRCVLVVVQEKTFIALSTDIQYHLTFSITLTHYLKYPVLISVEVLISTVIDLVVFDLMKPHHLMICNLAAL